MPDIEVTARRLMEYMEQIDADAKAYHRIADLFSSVAHSKEKTLRLVRQRAFEEALQEVEVSNALLKSVRDRLDSMIPAPDTIFSR